MKPIATQTDGGLPTHEAPGIALTVNGRTQRLRISPAARLADALRDELFLTGTKIGCNAGDCGACTVLLDGQQVCACLVPVGQCEGRAVMTVEGLAGPQGSSAELSRLQQCFIEHGAAQCGICTPGMLMAAADTLSRHPSPTESQVRDGIGGVLCRCTGYQKIVEAIMAAGRPDAAGVTDLEGSPGTPADSSICNVAPAAGAAVGARLPRLDALAKVTGVARFGADEAPADAWWLRVIRSPHANAGFHYGDLDDFVRRAGLRGVLVAGDIPNNRFAIFPDLRDQPAIAADRVRMPGEAVLVLVGTRSAVESVDVADVPVVYQVRPALSEIGQALEPGVELVHERWPQNVLCRGRVVRGDVEAAWGSPSAGRVHQASLATAYVEHAYIEPEAGWASYLPACDGRPARVTVFACTQTPYMDRDELAFMFDLAPEQVRIIPSEVGGGFGGKLDLSIQPLLVAAAIKFGAPARIVYSRPESMLSTTKRHPSTLSAKLTLDRQGELLAYDFSGDFNTGAYASWGPTVANRVPIHASGPYRVANVRALTRAVHTHNVVSGAFRGFGVPQSTLLLEALLDEAAKARDEDPLEFRYRVALRAGDSTPTGQILSASVGLQACLAALRPGWRQACEQVQAFNRRALAESAATASAGTGSARNPQGLRRGAGLACMWYGIGNTVIANPSTMSVGLKPDGRFVLFNGAVDIGQGTYTIMPQIVADAMGVPVSQIDQVFADTDLTADAGKSSASRQTFVSGNAARLAGLQLRNRLLEMAGASASAALRIEGALLIVESDAGTFRLELGSLPCDSRGLVASGEGYFNPPTIPLDADGQGVPYATYGFAAQFAVVEVDQALGTVKVLSIEAAHDVGRSINPTQVEGQIHGGIAQGLGLALMEEYLPGRSDNLHDYLIPSAGDIPAISVHLIEDAEPLGPYGAKGVGEPALVATAPAILNAIHDATGVRADRVPLTPDRLRAALLANAGH